MPDRVYSTNKSSCAVIFLYLHQGNDGIIGSDLQWLHEPRDNDSTKQL